LHSGRAVDRFGIVNRESISMFREIFGRAWDESVSIDKPIANLGKDYVGFKYSLDIGIFYIARECPFVLHMILP
jgi:hypothetical protein